MNVAGANSFIVYNMMHPNELTLFDFKTTVSNYLVARYTRRGTAPSEDNTELKRKYWYRMS